MLRIIDSGIIDSRAGRGAFFPVVTQLSEGTFLCTQFVGASLSDRNAKMELLRSDDEGRTWTNVGRIGGGALAQAEGDAYRSPQIYEDDEGTWLLKFNRFRFVSDTIFDAEGCEQPSDMLIARSCDQGATWTEPEIVPVALPTERYAWHGIGLMLRSPSGRWLYPFETGKPLGCKEESPQVAGAVVSRDRGKTWEETVVVASDPSARLLYYDQTGCILPDGRVCVLLWTHDSVARQDINNHVTLSEDEGRTWSEPRPTNLRGQCCIPAALPDGRVAAVYNYRHEPQGVRVALSEDFVNFDTQTEVVVFDAGDDATVSEARSDAALDINLAIGFGRPFGTTLPNGDLYVTFWCTRDGITRTRWVRLGVQ